MADKLISQIHDSKCSYYENLYSEFMVDIQLLLSMYEFSIAKDDYDKAKRGVLWVRGLMHQEDWHSGAFVDDEGEEPDSGILRKMRLRKSCDNIKNIWKAFWKKISNLLYSFFHKE